MPDLAPTALDAEAVKAEPKVAVPLAPEEQAAQLEAKPVPAASVGKRASIPSVRFFFSEGSGSLLVLFF